MNNPNAGGRTLKRNILKILTTRDLDSGLEALLNFPAQKVINALFSLLISTDENVKWAAVTAMGAVVSKIAGQKMEAARVIMRRLMWNLNDESGGIGWGSPEAMGEILACHEGLAEEYSRVFLSYAQKDGNYLELEMLQRGLLWGIGRLSQVRPHLVQHHVEHLFPYLESGDTIVRGLAVWVFGILGTLEAKPLIEKLKEDSSEIRIYESRRFVVYKIKDLAIRFKIIGGKLWQKR